MKCVDAMESAAETDCDVWPLNITTERARVLGACRTECSVLECWVRFAVTGCLVGREMTAQDTVLLRNLLGRVAHTIAPRPGSA